MSTFSFCRSTCVQFALLANLFFCSVLQLSAWTDWIPVNPDELKMTSVAEAPGASAVLLYRQVDRDDNGSTSHQFNYLRIKILTEEGRKYADVEIPYWKEQEQIVNIRARTIRPDGSIANFEGKAFDKSIVKAKGVKYLAKTFTLSDVQVGSIIEYYYTQDFRERYIFDSHWILSDELFTRKAKFSLKPFANPYSNISVRWSWSGLPPGTPQPKEGADHVVRLEVLNIPAFQTEDFMPPADELKARVDFNYSDDLPESDPAKFWKKVGKKRNDQLESFIGKHKVMEQAVTQIVGSGDPPETKLRKIYDHVQQMRNTSYEVEKTSQEEKRDKQKAPANVEEIWRRGYGDGQQLTWLYLALARAAGLESYGVWVSPRSKYFFYPQVMDSNKLSANVVQAKVNGKEIYGDPGYLYAPFGLLPWYETGVQGLKLDKEGGAWIRTDMPPSSESQIERTGAFKLNEETGGLEGKLTLKFTGLEAAQRRMEKRNVDDADRKEYLEDLVKEYIPTGIEVELTNQPTWNSSEVPLQAEYRLKVPGWASSAGKRAMLPVGLFGGTEKHLFDHADRTHPVYFEFPLQKVDDITVELPAGWKVSSLPAEQNHVSKLISYTLKVQNENGKVHIQRLLDVGVLLVEKQHYEVLRNFFQVVRTGDEAQVVLQPGTATASK